MFTNIHKNKLLLIGCLLLFIALVGCSKDNPVEPVVDPQPEKEPLILPVVLAPDCNNIEYPVLGVTVDSIFGVELYFDYDSTLITFDSLSSSYLDKSQTLTNVSNGVINVIWVDMSLHSFSLTSKDTLMVLYFSDLQDKTTISFNTNSSLFDASGNTIKLYTDGSDLIDLTTLEGHISCK